MYPTFLIAGPPKSATTSLHFYLGQHPQVFMSRVKETEFFTRDYHKGKAFYQHYFANADKAVSIGEATPSYSFLPFAVDRIHETIPHVKIIFCFRNPMERAFSHWLTLWSEGIEKESFSKAITINKEQLKYVNFQGEPGSVQWNKTARHEKKEKNWIRPYLHPGMYVQSLRIYFERFERKNIWIIFLEDLKDNFDKTMKDIFVFLGVDGNFTIPQKDVQNFSYNKRLYRSMANLIGYKATGTIAQFLPASIKNFIKRGKKKDEMVKMSNEEYLVLWQFYEAEIKELSKITGKDLSNWGPK